MYLDALVRRFRDRPFFETREVEALFDEPRPQVQARLSRWVANGKLVRLRRGKYLLPAFYRRVEPSVYYISNYLLRPSYVSLHSAMEYHGLIPEGVGVLQALTPKHGSKWATPVGSFRYQSVGQDRFFGYRSYSLGRGQVPLEGGPRAAQQAFLMAVPEKAILDLFYLSPGEWSRERIVEMRFQNVDQIDGDRLRELAARYASPKVTRATERFILIHSSARPGQ